MHAAQSTETWQRMWAVYHDALERPAELRRSFVVDATGGDAALESEVLSLLESHDQAGARFLDPPRALEILSPEAEPPIAPMTGRRIGRYLVGDMLAEGGSAVVYEAQQFDPPKAVALKVVRRGLADRQATRRFEAEAAVLARLQHPGIAQVFEAGSFDLGDGAQPYFAMELVRGLRLTDFAATHGLDVRRRVQLVVDVCEAVHHAHLRGVIHRDLKPSNILVEDGGEAGAARIKVLDFGVSQLTDGDMGPQRATLLHEVVGTLPYMSPEQVSGDARSIDARTDVYALGVVCHELLAGCLPLRFESASLFDAIKVIRDQEPARLGAADQRLRGDLELIVYKALEKDAARRYASSSELAADLRHWLDCEPIAARPATRRYRVMRFTQRNKALVISLCVTMLALATGAVVATRQAVQARKAERLASTRAENARALAASVIERMQNAISTLPATTSVRAELIAETIRFLDDIDNEFSDDPDLLLMAARAHEKMGRVLGSPRGASLNDAAGSIAEYQRSLSCLAAAEDLAPQRIDIVRQTGLTHMGMTDALLQVDRVDEALTHSLLGAAAYRNIVNSTASADSLESVGLYRLSSEIARNAGRHEAVAQALMQSREVLNSLRPPPDEELVEQMYLGRSWAEYGRQLLEAEDDQCLAVMQQAESIIAVATARGGERDMSLEFTIDAIRSQVDALMNMDRIEEAAQVAGRCCGLCEELLTNRPSARAIRSILAHVRRLLASAQLQLGDSAAAISQARKSVEQALILRDLDPNAGILRGEELKARIWLLNTLLGAIEQSPAGSDESSIWLSDANAVMQQIDQIRSEAAANGIPLSPTSTNKAGSESTVTLLRSRLETLNR